MVETKLAPTTWHKPPKPFKQPNQPKPKKRLDIKFEEWAVRQHINLKDIPLMRKK